MPMFHPGRETRFRRRGAVHLWVVLIFLVLLGLTGLGIDYGYLLYVKGQVQATADAAALGGALWVRWDEPQARQQAVDTAAANQAAGVAVTLDPNTANAAGGDVVLGRFIRSTGVFDPASEVPNAVQVNAHRSSVRNGPVNLFFGPIFGVNTADVDTSAIAVTASGPGAALLVLDPDDFRALDVGGTVVLNVTGGPIQVNSNATCAANFTGSGSTTCSEILVVGTACLNSLQRYDGYLEQGVLPRADPLSGLPTPTWDAAADLGGVTVGLGETMTLSPGYYSGGITVRGTADFEPGIYVVRDLKVNSGATVTGDGVMFYVTTGGVDFSAGINVNLSPPDPNVHLFAGANTYEGMSLFQARTNTSFATFSMQGGASLTGTWYFPKAEVRVHSAGNSFLSRMIANTFKFSGDGTLGVDYSGNEGAVGPVYLVR